MMEHGYVVLTTKGATFNNIMKMEFFDGTDIGLNPEKISGYIKINPLVSFYTHFLPMFNDEHHYLAKDNYDNVGVFIDTTDHPGIVGMFLWYWVMDKLLNIYDEDYLKQIRSGEIALYRKDGFREILIFDKTKTSVLCNNPKDICDHIKSIANGGVGAQHNGHTYDWPASKIRLILFDMLDSDGNVVKTIPYFHNEGISQAPIGVIFEKLQKMVRIFEPDDLELNCLVNCKYKYTSTYIMLDKEAAKNNKYL